MASGIHSTIASLQTRLFHRWVPKWYGAFCDPSGGFYERLGSDFKPLFTGQRRLVTQCRQLAIYSDYCNRQKSPIQNNLKNHFEFILKNYHDSKTGLWFFSNDDDGRVSDSSCDFYALSFVIFSFSHYYRVTKDERAKQKAFQVLKLIDEKFRLYESGFAESLDDNFKALPRVRRQDPHMHLLEACLFAHATWGDDAYIRMADELVSLFQANMYDQKNHTVIEFYDDDLKTPHTDKGHIFQPGHSFEWVWLLKKYETYKGSLGLCDPITARLFDFANQHGWDEDHGGIYDGVGKDGAVLIDTKRIWPFCEALKANALMIGYVKDKIGLKQRMVNMTQVFNQKYMSERGFWTEWLNRDLTTVTDYMPGTTPYHVYFGITETMDILNKRGDPKSIIPLSYNKIYGVRRMLSVWARKIRDGVFAKP